MTRTAHPDTYARDRLPPPDQLPEFLFELPELQFPARVNCAHPLLDRWVAADAGERLCVQAAGGVRWSYRDLQEWANRIANVLVHEMGIVPGNRVLLRAPNTPLLVACWFAVVKAGGIAVATMPLLRAKELRQIVETAQVTHALCDARLEDELRMTAHDVPVLAQLLCFGGEGAETLEAAAARQPAVFENVDTAADDVCMIAFTSGTSGKPKATLHFHRDVLAACACWPRHVLKPTPEDRFIGSPPLAFTFGLGGLVLFPFSIGASTILVENPGGSALPEAIARFGATVLFTAPTSYRALADEAGRRRVSALHGGTLRKCVSAGEALPVATRTLWRDRTGIELIDGIGATEMLHIFISAAEDEARPGATGKVVPGYRACVLDDDGNPLPPNVVGRLAVKGPTGCRYLDDPRQASYVQGGWNITGDAYLVDDDGYFHYQARTDDMIVSAGYNIAAPEVEEALLMHPDVAECGVIGVPDGERGQVVKAFVVLRDPARAGDALVDELQRHVKSRIAPYKYPRRIEFRTSLPRTQTGKLQRFRLREPA